MFLKKKLKDSWMDSVKVCRSNGPPSQWAADSFDSVGGRRVENM